MINTARLPNSLGVLDLRSIPAYHRGAKAFTAQYDIYSNWYAHDFRKRSLFLSVIQTKIKNVVGSII